MSIDLRSLSDEDRGLIPLASALIDTHGDGDAGVHTMGVAVRDVHGRTYGGADLFHSTGGPCAELVALGRARAEGARELTTVAVVGDRGRGPVGPADEIGRSSSTTTPPSASSCRRAKECAACESWA